MKNRHRATRQPKIKLTAAAVASCFASHLALANPTGPTVVNGQVTFLQQGNLLQITNSPNSIINWQSFSIGTSEITRFLQQSPSSAVLNRVTTQNPSSILGALQSNGRVFLINPNGIAFGAGAQIDVAGLVASTLKLSDTDFLAGRLRFTDGAGAGSVINQGTINTESGGHVYLVGPSVTNGGVISSPRGEVVLAAGNSVELVDPGTPNLRVEITAPDNQAINLGQIVADSGRVGIYAGLINQSGVVQANTAVATEDGRIVLKATNGATLAPGSTTLATGPLAIEAGDITIAGIATSGPQTINASGGLVVESSAAGPAQLNATGGQTINARSIEVTAQDGNTAGIFNSSSGDQVITVAGGGSSPGIDVQSLASGGQASIGNSAPGALQVITVSDADHINVNGMGPSALSNVSAIISAGAGTQTISITGSGANAINVGSAGAQDGSVINALSQNIAAGASGQSGSITIVGPAVNGSLAAILTNQGVGTQNISTSGALTITGGSAPAQLSSNPSGMGHNSSGPQTVTAESVTLQGGLSGSRNAVNIRSAGGGDQTINASHIAITGGTGTNNFAMIERTAGGSGHQTVNVTDGTITLQGGSGGGGNFARIRNDGAGTQTISGSPTITITGGSGGVLDMGNQAQIRAVGPQVITAGPTTLIAGPSGFNNLAGIHGPDQDITIHGDLTLTGGGSISGATSTTDARIGGLAGADPTPTNLVLVVEGNVTMNGGNEPNASPVIGSSFIGGQRTDITMNVGGNLTLGTGTAGASSARIGSPSTNPSSFAGGDISITAGGNITLDNATVVGTRSVIRTLDSLTLDANNISVGGSLISRAQTINAVGDFTVAAPNAVNALVTASGPQSITAGGALTVQGGAGTGLSAQILGAAGQSISASSFNVMGGNTGSSSVAEIHQTGLGAGQAITASDSITIAGGPSGTNNFARIRNEGMGAQTITGSPTITITGGTGGAPDQGNFAQIRSSQSLQSITAGNVSLTGGGPGFNNFAGIHSPNQIITVHGDLTLTGGSSSPGSTSVGAARIGGNGGAVTSPTNLLLVVDNDVIMNGGAATNAGSTIGSSFDGGQPTNITMNVGGNLIMNPGTVALSGSRIGSPSVGLAGGNISIDAGGSITMNGAITPGTLGSVIRTLDGVMLDANAIVQGETARIQAGSLVTSTANGTSLTGSNQVASFNATNTTSGDIALNNARPLLTVTGVNQLPFGALSINQTGDLTLTGMINSGPQFFSATGNISVMPGSPTLVISNGLQTINAGGGLILQSSAAGPTQLTAFGGQTITARYVEVTAQDNPALLGNSFSGDQLITTTGMNSSGEGLVLRNIGGLGEFAFIGQNVLGGTQVINVNNADRVTIDGAGGNALLFNNSGTQTLRISGTGDNALALGHSGSLGASQIGGGGTQTVIAGMPGEQGSITIIGKAAGSGGNSIIVSNPVPGGSQTVSTPGTLTVIGGTSPAGSSAAGIFANGTSFNGVGGQQTISAGAIALHGGPGGSGNSAQIGALNGAQHVTVGAEGISLTGGTGGTNNAAVIFGAAQDIFTTGNVTLNGASTTGNSARIGGRGGTTPGVTNLVLNAGGDVVLNSGSAVNTAALIGGTTSDPALPNNIEISAGGNVILNAGSGAGARIGSPAPAVGGDVSISAGGSIQLNGSSTQVARIRTLDTVTLSAGAEIGETSNGGVEANALTTTSNAGTTLTGPNQVASFNATNATTGDIALVNSGNLAVMATNSAPGGKVTINNLSGDLSTSGAIAASGGGAADIALVAGGAVNITRPVTASGIGNVSLTGGAITVDDTSVTAGGLVAVNGVSLDVKGVSAGAAIRAGNGFDADLSGDLRVYSASPGGTLGGWSTIQGGNGPVDISAGNVTIEGGKNLGGFAAITGGPITIATTGDLAIRGGSGIGAFGWLLSDQDIDLTIGGSLRLNSGTGFGSFARLETIGPSSTISVHFPNRLSGGYFVNGVEGRIAQGLTGFFTGFRPARLGDTLIVTYGQ